MSAIIRFARLKPGAVLPKRATPGSGAFDIYAYEDGYIGPFSKKTLPTGIAHDVSDIAILPGFALHGQMISRSGLARFDGIRLFYQGLIDHDYRGEIHIELENYGVDTFSWKQGDRLCQMAYVLTFMGDAEEIDPSKLSKTTRGTGAFGSTGR